MTDIMLVLHIRRMFALSLKSRKIGWLVGYSTITSEWVWVYMCKCPLQAIWDQHCMNDKRRPFKWGCCKDCKQRARPVLRSCQNCAPCACARTAQTRTHTLTRLYPIHISCLSFCFCFLFCNLDKCVCVCIASDIVSEIVMCVLCIVNLCCLYVCVLSDIFKEILEQDPLL